MKNTTLLSSSISLAVPSPRPGPRLPSLFVAIAMLLLLLSIASSTYADSATWKSSPATGDWNTAANWTPMTVPNGPSDTATFATSNRTAVSLSANTEVNGIVFNAGASAFTITGPGANILSLTISGVGITNNSGITQKFVAAGDPSNGYPGLIRFFNSATAGSSTSFTLNTYAYIYFYNASTAGGGTFTLNGDRATGFSSFMQFRDSSTAGNGIFTVNGAARSGYPGSNVAIALGATAGNGTFTINGSRFSGAIGTGATMTISGNA